MRVRPISRPFVVLVLGASALLPGSVHAKGDEADRAERAAELTLAHDYDDAKKELAGGDPDDPLIVLEEARLALYQGDCDGAAALLARPDVAKFFTAARDMKAEHLPEQGSALADVARGCARATAATVVDRDDAHAVEVRYQDELDRALTPILVETVVKARDAIAADLGATWPKPTRITVVRDLLSLAAMTGLPYEAAQTTGTVAVAKWGRVTLLSPRASRHGYAWRDTIAHELTHLAVTSLTADRAPLWLQEGLAKREEVRWRDPGPFDDRPSADAVVARGIELKLDVPLDKLGPSIAMLPSADAAMVAFAEVTSFVRRLAADPTGGGGVPVARPPTNGSAGALSVHPQTPDVLPRLLGALRDKKSLDDALVLATGAKLKEWELRWRAAIASEKKEPLPLMFALGGGEPANMRDLRERARLAELLLGRDHPGEALMELDKLVSGTASGTGAGKDPLADASIRYTRARALEALGRVKDAEQLVADPKDVVASYGSWWAIRGRFARGRGDEPLADAAFVEAVAADPLDAECACESLEPARGPKDPAHGPLCDAARHRDEPKLGGD
jgi:hypothetical protein